MADVYYWCQLKNGSKRTCGYIPARGALVGKSVELIDLDGEFWEGVLFQAPKSVWEDGTKFY